VAVPYALTLVFQTVLARQSVSQVVRVLREPGLRLPRRHRNCETIWRTPTVAAAIASWRHPAYTGTCVYGTTRPQPQPGRARPPPHRLSPAEWTVMVHNRSPADMTWETFERIQAILEANDAADEHHRRRGVPRHGAALVQGLVACGICGHTMVVPSTGGHQSLCTYLRAQTQAPVCQRLPADPVDPQVVAAFFPALAPAELDLDEQARPRRRQCQADVDRAHHSSVQRRRYEADLARRRYERVDPENRRVADELERRWEAALQALHEAEEHDERLRQQAHTVGPLSIPRMLRTAFTSLGTSRPTVWPQDTLSRAQRQARLRCLIDKVVRQRVTREMIQTRMVWRGGAVSELEVPSTVGALHDLTGFAEMDAQMLALETQGKSEAEIAPLLTTRGFRSPQRAQVLPSTVQTLRLRHGRLHRYRGPRPRHVPGRLTVSQLAIALGVKAHWVYHLIRRGRIVVARDPATRLSLFPDHPETLQDFRRWPHGHITPLQS